jgi:membrane fusion protein (multidrug efflux system)
MTPFKAGQRVGHYYIVDSGLSSSDKIVFEGTQSLSDGLQVKPTDISINAMNTVAKN